MTLEYAINKPKVFLSHSKADCAFIERIAADLRHCQIEPWLDSEEIRHGQPWLDAIFQIGIPVCDCVLVYLTPASIESAMVKKEIDASILQKLRDSQVGFLPYVSEAALRDRLRADIRALQTPEWNTHNCHIVFPQLVAEVWRSYLERMILRATNTERVRRLEAQLELERVQKDSDTGLFTTSEEKDFAYICQALDRQGELVCSVTKRKERGESELVRDASFFINKLSLTLAFLDSGCHTFEDRELRYLLMELLKSTDGYPTSLPNDQVLELTDVPTLESDLLMFGLVEPTEIVENIPKFKAQLVIMSIHPGQHFVWCSHGRLSDSGIGWP